MTGTHRAAIQKLLVELGAACHFTYDLAGLLARRVQLTTNGHQPNLAAVEDVSGCDIDLIMPRCKRFTALHRQSKAKLRKLSEQYVLIL
jgi:hypothetical protein